MAQLAEMKRIKPEGRGPCFGPSVGTSSKINDYQGYLLCGKGSRCVGLTTSATFMCRSSRDPGIVNLLVT